MLRVLSSIQRNSVADLLWLQRLIIIVPVEITSLKIECKVENLLFYQSANAPISVCSILLEAFKLCNICLQKYGDGINFLKY